MIGKSLSVLQDVFHQMQHHTLTVQECNGSRCTTEVVNVHDTAMLNGTHNQTQAEDQINSLESRLASVTIQKQVGKPLVVTVKQDDSDPGLQVQSGGELLTDEAKIRVAALNQAATQSNLSLADSTSAESAANVVETLSKHGAAARHEGDNVLDIHRDDIDLSKTTVNPVSVNVTDDNSLQIMQDTDSSSLLSGFNSDKGREVAEQDQQQQQQQQQDPPEKGDAVAETKPGVMLESAKRRLYAHYPLPLVST